MPNKQMVSNYEVLKTTPNIMNLIQIGVISCHILQWIEMYEFYLEQRKTKKKMQSYSDTAEIFNFSERQIINLVNYMENETAISNNYNK